MIVLFFFFNDTATTEIYTLSLHDALPICEPGAVSLAKRYGLLGKRDEDFVQALSEVRNRYAHSILHHAKSIREVLDRKSTRLNSSHANISYAVFCLKKKKNS